MTQDPFYEPDSSSYYSAPQAPPPQKKNNTVIIIIVVVVLLLLCCCAVGAIWALWTYGDQIMYELGLNVMSALFN